MVAWPHALGQNITMAGTCGRGPSSPHDRQEAATQEGARDKVPLRTLSLSDLLLAGSYLLKFPEPLPPPHTHLKIGPPAGDQVFNT
jgi:hypothetical protein